MTIATVEHIFDRLQNLVEALETLSMLSAFGIQPRNDGVVASQVFRMLPHPVGMLVLPIYDAGQQAVQIGCQALLALSEFMEPRESRLMA